jgi:hypothetical protein
MPMIIMRMTFNNINNNENNKIIRSIINDLLLLFEQDSCYRLDAILVAKHNR